MPLNFSKRRRLRNAGARLPHLATRVFNTPLAIHPEKMGTILTALGPHLGLNALSLMDDSDDWDDPSGAALQLDQQRNGVGIITVCGTLVKRATGMEAASGLVCYSDIRNALASAMANDDCSAIVLDFSSPGGEVGDMFETAEYISSLRSSKPIIGIAGDAYSAAYCLAAACGQVLVARFGGVGSIGCFMLHCDQSEADRMAGLNYRYVFSGTKKTEGNPHQPLSPEAAADDQRQCDAVRMAFVQSVARNRGVDPLDVYKTEAACYTGSDACPMLADGIGDLDAAIELARSRGRGARSVVMSPGHKAGRTELQTSAIQAGSDNEAELIAGLLPVFRASRWADKQVSGHRILALRGAGTLALAGSTNPRVRGLLAPYGSLSLDLGNFKEIYSPGCFARSLSDGSDARVLFNHNVDFILGRRSAGTARFWEEPDGLYYEADLPDTQYARDLKELIARRDVSQSSAGFYITQYHWEQRGVQRVRVIEEARLVEGGPNGFAAYESSTSSIQGTNAADRSLSARLESARRGHVSELSETDSLIARLNLLARS